jgi:hypothetical protein
MPSTYICVSFIVFSIPRITYVNVMTLWCSLTMHFHYYLTLIFVLPTVEINDNVILHFIIDILPISTKPTITFHFYLLSFNIRENNDIWCWKITSWFGTGTHIYQFCRTNKNKPITITHMYMTTHLPGLVYERQSNKSIDIARRVSGIPLSGTLMIKRLKSLKVFESR